jgi:hypothetical protein
MPTLDHHESHPPGVGFVQFIKTCRSACCSWARKQKPLEQHEADIKILIDALDLLEEIRPLSTSENDLRCLAAQGVQEIHEERLAFWKQRFNL